jgi:ssDNA-binding Zn-finger/Zn-ribbon topoisomerase 1
MAAEDHTFPLDIMNDEEFDEFLDSLEAYRPFGENSKCPRCESPMVRRQNRITLVYFYGCSKYPSCKGTRPEFTHDE